MAYTLLNSQTVPSEVTENASRQATALGSLSGAVVDVQTFEALFQAVSLDPSFEIPLAFVPRLTPPGSWVC